MAMHRVQEFSSDSIEFAGNSVSGTALFGQVSNIDFTLTENLLLTGTEVYLDGNQHWDDHVTLQVLYGDTVVNEFATSWRMSGSTEKQANVLTIPANIPAGLKIRIRYSSAGTTDVKLKCNFHLYRPK